MAAIKKNITLSNIVWGAKREHSSVEIDPATTFEYSFFVFVDDEEPNPDFEAKSIEFASWRVGYEIIDCEIEIS